MRKERVQVRSDIRETQENLRPWPDVFAASRVTTLVATWFGTGFLPAAPGTWASLVAIPLASLVAAFAGAGGLFGFALGVALIGVHAAGETARLRGRVDPPEIVVDEVAGQSIALVPVWALVPQGAHALRIGAALSSFLIFRILDVWKPGPIAALERLPHGWGIMADDVVAGVIAAVFVGTALVVTR